MVQITNWDAIPDAAEYERPTPGGYIGTIVDYEDHEELNRNGKGQYLKLYWDFAEGPLTGSLNEAYLRLGYWFGYGTFIRSYKENAMPYFKAFKTCLEVSNPRYVFQTNNLDAMKGKRIGVVLGEEEYRRNDGTVGTRLYVAQVRSVKAIQEGDFKVPELKKLGGQSASSLPGQPVPAWAAYNDDVPPLPDDGDIPF